MSSFGGHSRGSLVVLNLAESFSANSWTLLTPSASKKVALVSWTFEWGLAHLLNYRFSNHATT